MSEITNVLMCGVGGQGDLLASELLIEVARVEGLEVRKSEVHGMAQRGGAVFSHVRFGKNVYSPIIPNASADFILAFEYMEALRYQPMFNKDTKVFINTHRLVPTTVQMGGPAYPENVEDSVRKLTQNVWTVPAFDLAEKLGNTRAENVVLLAAAASKMKFEKQKWLDVMKLKLKPKIYELNVQAFEKGWTLLK